MADKFRKRPVVIEAVQWTGGNAEEVAAFFPADLPPRFTSSGDMPDFRQVEIDTLEGTMRTDPGDWIIKGVAGEFYPCKPDIFEATYERVG
jgi:hypothetical protein